MRALLIGCGSIGRRHLGNLKKLGVSDWLVFDPAPERARAAADEYGARAFSSLGDALAACPELAVIAAPNRHHLPAGLAAAKAGAHLFIEKPLSDSLDGIDELEDVVRSKSLSAAVGCNFRFHAGLKAIKAAVENGVIGSAWSARILAGFYLPDWHPGEDYRKGYSARADLGGGIVLDAIHQIDYAQWLFGPAREITAVVGRVSDLEIDVEDSADILLTTAAGPVVNLRLDYLQRAYSHRVHISGSAGTLEWDAARPALRIYAAADKTWCEQVLADDGVDAMYLEQFRDLLTVLKSGRPSHAGLLDGRRALAAALAAKRSSLEKRAVTLDAAA